MIFIPNKDNSKLGFKVGKGIELEKNIAEKLTKQGFGILKKSKKKGRPVTKK